MSRFKLFLKDYVGRDQDCYFGRAELGVHGSTKKHEHDFMELFWVESGEGIHWIQSERRPISSGRLIFVLPQDFHLVCAAKPGASVVICNLAFRCEAWRRVNRLYFGGRCDWFARGRPEVRERQVSPAVFNFLRRAGDEMLPAPRSRLMLDRFFLNLAFALGGRESEPKKQDIPAWLQNAVSSVEREGLFRAGPSVLTRAAGRSQEHVVRETRRWLGRTPTEVVNEMRMRQAAALLAKSPRKIIDVCFECGFENLGHFYALFRQYHQMTPRQYQLRSRSILQPVAR
jgi:AraC family cel operon transcriptional repressor